MAQYGNAKSFQRTDSTGQLHVFVVLKLKSNDSFKLISRDNLPNTLRYGRLSLNQKIIIRDETRSNVEGVVVYIHPERAECVQYMKNMVNRSDSRVNSSPEYQTNVFENGKNTTIQEQNYLPLSNSNNSSEPDVRHQSNNTSNPSGTQNQASGQQEAIGEISIDLDDIISMLDVDVNRFDHEEILDSRVISTANASMTEHRTLNDVYLEKIKKLSIKVQQQAASIKERDEELKSLRATSIGLPSDPAVIDYLSHLVEKVRHESSGHKYTGHLPTDARLLGMSAGTLNEILQLKNGISSIAREIFMKLIPKECTTVDNWNNLPEDVLLKEKILIDFLVRYFGRLQADPKKIHITLVSCLRNNRGQKKRQQKLKESNASQMA